MQAPTSTDLTAILPTLVLVAWGLGMLMASLAISRQRRFILVWLALVGLGLALLVAVLRWNKPVSGFDGTVVLDNYALFLSFVIIVAAMLTVLLSFHYLRERGTCTAPLTVARGCFAKQSRSTGIGRGEYYPLLLFSVGGMTLMTGANDLVILFIALELFSIPLYVLTALGHSDAKEAALKHFLLGVFASAFFIYGVALVYGGSGTTALPELAKVGGAMGGNPALTLVGAGLILVGLAFKVAAVPFHAWLPDVYQGAPAPVAGFMSVGVKGAGLAALGRIFVPALSRVKVLTLGRAASPLGDDWVMVLAVLSALTMILGSVVALAQTDVKRMLAYSSIAHSGYALMGVAARSERGLAGMLFYLLIYAFASLGAFAVLTWVADCEDEDTSLAPYAGLSRRRPWIAAAMALFMFSLAGTPLTAGFVGKCYLFWAAVEADLIWLAIVGVLTSLVSLGFYLRVVVMMYFSDYKVSRRGGDVPSRFYPALVVALVITAVATLVLGLWPGPLLSVVQNSL